MTTTHNHQPWCCCEPIDVDPEGRYDLKRCPACPEHGDLASPAECPSCHQLPGRPPTDYCQDHTWHDRMGIEGVTVPLDTRTTVAGVGEMVTPTTHIRDGILRHSRAECHPLVCGRLPMLGTNIRDTPEQIRHVPDPHPRIGTCGPECNNTPPSNTHPLPMRRRVASRTRPLL